MVSLQLIFTKHFYPLFFFSFAENAIGNVKRRLYRMMRSSGDQNWPKLLPLVIRAINHSPQLALANLTPSDISHPTDEPKLREAVKMMKSKMTMKQAERYFPHYPDYQSQERNKEKYQEEDEKIKLGSYVYLNFVDEAMTKSFDVKVRLGEQP